MIMLGLRGELAATYAATVSCRLSDPVKEIALFVYPIYHGVMKEQTPKAKWKPLTFMKYYSYFGTSSLILSAYKLTCDFYFYFYFFATRNEALRVAFIHVEDCDGPDGTVTKEYYSKLVKADAHGKDQVKDLEVMLSSVTLFALYSFSYFLFVVNLKFNLIYIS